MGGVSVGDAMSPRQNALSVYETLERLKIELPALTKPVAAFLPFTLKTAVDGR